MAKCLYGKSNKRLWLSVPMVSKTSAYGKLGMASETRDYG